MGLVYPHPDSRMTSEEKPGGDNNKKEIEDLATHKLGAKMNFLSIGWSSGLLPPLLYISELRRSLQKFRPRKFECAQI